ncbi:protein of unknown function [Methylorubrum extorquens]|uniref:Uncharacterized protein n=1 Tax=Methylorubrum extorquens TaxID=408 RepID=A0A2N9AH68_METEX|nr:protein of unknown function [Methylorubrum extorquens]
MPGRQAACRSWQAPEASRSLDLGRAALLLTFIDQGGTGEKPATAARKHGSELEVMKQPSDCFCGAAQAQTEARSGPCSQRRRRANP